MNASAKAGCAGGILTLLLVMTAAVATAAGLPDWSGTWRVRGSMATIDSDTGRMFVPGTRDHPPFKPPYEKQYVRDLVRAQRQGDPRARDVLTDTNTLHCFAGMPRLIATPFDYEFVVTPGEVWILIDKAVRRIFTDGRDWPAADARWPLMLGRSRGHWEGDTLVIETVDMRSDMWVDTTPVMLSNEARVLERIRMTDRATLRNDVTITDPVKFSKDWQFTRFYVRDDMPMWPDDPELCGGPDDRNPIVNGRVTVQLPHGRPRQ
ncbi:MAG TPA: hypothetical protein VMC02_13605 [Steroidobacteraceae bacterium]|nr:hypothetical protein [Steroidobacteraceae bacterium]